MKIQSEVCVCNVCGWRWLAEGDKEPERCPSRKCRSRAWNVTLLVPTVPIKLVEKKLRAMAKNAKTEPYSVKTVKPKMSDAEYKAMLRDKVKLKT